jgi:hypothetical protein
VRSDFPGAAGIPRQLDHVPFDLNRVSPLVIAGLDPAIHAEKTLRRPCRNVFDCGKSAWMRGSSPRMTKETVRIRTESALERDEFRLNRCQPILRLCQFFRHGTAAYKYISCIYLDLDNNSLMRKMLRRRELFPAVEGGAVDGHAAQGSPRPAGLLRSVERCARSARCRGVWPHRRRHAGAARPSR